jgi:hypothetical protein
MRGHVEIVLKRGDGNLQCKELWYCDSWHFVDVALLVLPTKATILSFDSLSSIVDSSDQNWVPVHKICRILVIENLIIYEEYELSVGKAKPKQGGETPVRTNLGENILPHTFVRIRAFTKNHKDMLAFVHQQWLISISKRIPHRN